MRVGGWIYHSKGRCQKHPDGGVSFSLFLGGRVKKISSRKYEKYAQKKSGIDYITGKMQQNFANFE